MTPLNFLEATDLPPSLPNLKKPKRNAHYVGGGYRLNTNFIENVLCRASLIGYIRSIVNDGKYVGIYVTASHNLLDYNGIKFIDFDGRVFDDYWEIHTEDLVNCYDSEFHDTLRKIFKKEKGKLDVEKGLVGNIVIGRDTRESGVRLAHQIIEVLEAYGCNTIDYGLVSYPEIQYLIKHCNIAKCKVDKASYINHIFSCTNELISLTRSNIKIGIDTSNGVARFHIEELHRKDKFFGLHIINQPYNCVLNEDCGACYIKTNKQIPDLQPTNAHICAAFDGDVDRLIFFDRECCAIYDGDAQSCYIAEYIRKEVEKEKLELEVGIVLSLYSDSAAVKYLESNKFKVIRVPKGIKNFLCANKKFDISVFFEPHGHGSVFFSQKAQEKILAIPRNAILKVLLKLFLPYASDALANLIVFKETMAYSTELMKYTQSFTRTLKVRVKDRKAVMVDHHYVPIDIFMERLITEATMWYRGSRAFIKPSESEDAVFIFAEFSDQLSCDKLALQVAQDVYDNYDGQGRHPQIYYNKKSVSELE